MFEALWRCRVRQRHLTIVYTRWCGRTLSPQHATTLLLFDLSTLFVFRWQASDSVSVVMHMPSDLVDYLADPQLRVRTS